jgi:hypothetical protein
MYWRKMQRQARSQDMTVAFGKEKISIAEMYLKPMKMRGCIKIEVKARR